MKKLLMQVIAAATVALSFTCVGADTPVEQYSGTISIPSGTTYQMSALTNYSAATFSLSGGTLDINGQTGPAKGISFSGSSTFTNSGETATLSVPSAFTLSGATLYVRGGKYTSDEILTMRSGNSVFELSGDDTELTFNRKTQTGYFGDTSDTATIRILGGKLVMNNSHCQYVASQPSSTCNFEMSGGKYSATDIFNCLSGTVNINITGGTFAPSYLRMGNRGSENTTKKTHTLTMTGGRLEIESEFYAPKSTTTYADCTVNLNGGVAKVVHIRSNTTPNATSTFTADGGTLQTRSAQDSYFYGFKTALLGEQGLTFQADHAITVSQKFTGLKDGAAYGTLVKQGAAALTLTGSLCDGVRFENLKGATTLTATSGAVRVTVTAGSVTLTDKGKFGANSELVVNNGSTLTLNGPVDPTTTASVSDGTLAINVSTTLASLTLGSEAKRVKLALGESAELIVTGEVTGDLAKSLFYSDYDYIVTKDDSGRTHIVRDLSPAKTLEIRLDEVGATSNATESLTFKGADTLAVSVAQDATLTMSGLYGRGKLEKSGAGAAVLTNPENLFAGGVTCREGRIAANPFAAFGLAEAATPLLTLVNGTVEVQGDEPVTYAGDFKVNATNSTAAVIIKTDTDVTLRKVSHTQGAIIKRGAGCLTIDPQNRSGTAMVLSRSAGVNAKETTSRAFDDANGTVPTTGYGGFNVAEGEFRLANGNFDFQGTTARVGIPLAAEPAAPVVFTVTNSTVKMGASGSDFFFIGNDFNSNAYGQTIRVNVIDSSISGSSAMAIGGYLSGGSSKERIYVGITNSTLTSTWNFCLAHNKNGKTYCNAYKSKLISQTMNLGGYVETILDDCFFAKNATGSDMYAGISMDNSDHGDSWTRFVGGSEAYISNLGVQGAYGRHTVIFDNATWYPASAMKLRWASDFAINFFLKTEGQGMTIAKPSDTCRNTFRIEGNGGITKTGAGTFFFDTRSWWSSDQTTETKCTSSYGITTWNFNGPVDIQEGVLAVTNGAIAATMSPTVHIAEGATWQMRGDVALTNVTLSGSGTVEGGTLTDPIIKVMEADGEVLEGPHFIGTVAGKVTIDFGHTAEQPLTRPFPKNLRVATLPAGAPALEFRARGLGCDYVNVDFVRDGNDVRCSVKPGMMILVR